MRWQCQAAYSCGVGGLQTMLRIFDRETVCGLQAEPLKRKQVAVWSGFARSDIVPGDNGREMSLEIVRTKCCIYSVCVGSRHDGEFQAGATKLDNGVKNTVH